MVLNKQRQVNRKAERGAHDAVKCQEPIGTIWRVQISVPEGSRAKLPMVLLTDFNDTVSPIPHSGWYC